MPAKRRCARCAGGCWLRLRTICSPRSSCPTPGTTSSSRRSSVSHLREFEAQAAAARQVLRRLGLRPADSARPRRDRAVRRPERDRQDDGRAGPRSRRSTSSSTASTSPASSTSTSARPRSACKQVFERVRARQRAAALRRGGCALRPAHAGEGRARPLRQHRDRLPAPAHGAVRRRRRPRHEPQERPRHGVPAPAALHRSTSRRRGRRAARGSGGWR